MTIKALYPASSSSLMLDAKRLKRLPSTYTFTRSSTATYVDKLGVLQTAAINQPRFDHSPTTIGKRLGLLIEESRTNSIRNNTMIGAVADTPGTVPTNWLSIFPTTGLTRTVVGTGAEGGINYVDVRLQGTTTVARTNIAVVEFELNTAVAAASGQTWTGSAYVALAAGSTSNLTSIGIQVSERNAVGGYLADSTTLFALNSGSLINSRQTCTRTLNNASTASVVPSIVISYSSDVAIDVTFRIGLPQLELGAFATSVIPTTGSTATRSADVCTVTGTNFSRWYRQDEGTVFADWRSDATSDRLIWTLSNGTFNESMYPSHLTAAASNNTRMAVVDGGVEQAGISSGVYTPSSLRKTSFGYMANNFGSASNGGSVGTDLSGTLPTVDRLTVGASWASALQLCGTISRLTYWPRRLNDTTLQNLTKT